jgi:endonuclease/exonuclease/phosphatase family metal-dependent hydrolase
VLAIVVNAVVLAPTVTADARPAAANSSRITLGHLNAQTRAIDTAALGRYLAATRPDVFVVLDPLQGDVNALRRAVSGYQARPTGSRPGEERDFYRTVVLSRIPIDGVDHPRDPALGPSAVTFRVPTPEGPISVLVMGTESPTSPSRAHDRDQTLNAAARWSTEQGPRRVVMGDFNATPWSPTFHRLLTAGRLYDSRRGFGLQVSWPSRWFPIRIPIDHALLGPGLAATDRGTGPSFGSQHRCLHVTIAARRVPTGSAT